MMIGPAIIGTIGSGVFPGLTAIPQPQYVNGAWWSFRQSPTFTTGILSEKSTNNGVTWVEDSDTDAVQFSTGTRTFGNGIITQSVAGTNLRHKDLDTPGSDWISTNVSSLGGAIGGGLNLITFDDTNNLFILNKALGEDIYTSPDCVNWTSINGGEVNELLGILAQAETILYVGGQFVAYGVKEFGNPLDANDIDVYGSATSPDLLNWTVSIPDAPRLFDRCYFSGAFYGTSVEGRSAKLDTLEVYKSTDYINWTKLVLPNIAAGSISVKLLITDTTLFVLSHSQVFESTDGTSFTEHESRYLLEFLPIVGKGPLLDNIAAPDRLLMTQIPIQEHGGKIIRWTGTLDALPELTLPSSNPAGAVIGFTNTKVIDNGFTAFDISGKSGLYLVRTSVRYFEYTIIASPTGGALNAHIGLEIPAERFFTGLSLSSILLTHFGVVETSSGDLPVDYTMEVGQVIGFIVNFITATVEIYVDNVLLTTIPNIATTALWTQRVDCAFASIGMNIGQDPFVYDQPSAVAWANEYV